MLVLSPEILRVAVRQDATTARIIVRRVKENAALAPLNLFGRRNPVRMLEYLDRRAGDRSRVQTPIYATCVGFDGTYIDSLPNAVGEMLAITREVSLRGIGFTRDEPLVSDIAKVTFDLGDDDAVSLLLGVRWSNVERSSDYMSGGRFLGVLEAPS